MQVLEMSFVGWETQELFSMEYQYLKCESSENKVSTSLELFDYFNSDVDHNLNSYYYCNLYPYGTTHINQIKRHSGKHNGERPFTCDTCGKSFTKKWHHKIHMRVHTGEKPYECPYCPSKFSDPSAFRRHQAVHKVSLS
ncbi:zinc finger and BTB domain-containing protein 24 [Trichonephila clavipes]|nr:zinc finger and BTB domain-containing protein 24 [Trichonephila clavipes]